MQQSLRIILLSLILGQGFGQRQATRLSVTPFFGLGMNIPGSQVINEGQEKMTYGWKVYKFGQYYINSSTTKFEVNTTNRFGFLMGFDISEKLQIHAGGNRTALVTSYKPPFTYDFDDITIVSFDGDMSYLNLAGGFKYKRKNSAYFQADFQYTPDVFKVYLPKNNQASSGSYDQRNSAGTGILYELTNFNAKMPSIYLALGKKMELLGEKTNIELGLNLGFLAYEANRVSYFRNGIENGSSNIKFTTNALFLSLNRPIYFQKNLKTPKPQKTEKTPIIAQPKERIVLGNKTISTGENLVLENIGFEQTKAVLDPAGMKELDIVYDFLRKYPTAIIELTGHTSSEGSRNDNLELSKKRAEACKDYLVRKGIKTGRIKSSGLGPDRPLSSTEKNKNRRVEVKVLSLD